MYRNTRNTWAQLDEYEWQAGAHAVIPSEPTLRSVCAQDISEDFRCAICLGIIEYAQCTKCIHRFCKVCIEESVWQSNKECPTCRTKVTSKRDLRADHNFDFLRSEIGLQGDEYDVDAEEIAEVSQRIQQHQSQVRASRASLDSATSASDVSQQRMPRLMPIADQDVNVLLVRHALDPYPPITHKFLTAPGACIMKHLKKFISLLSTHGPDPTLLAAHGTDSSAQGRYKVNLWHGNKTLTYHMSLRRLAELVGSPITLEYQRIEVRSVLRGPRFEGVPPLSGDIVGDGFVDDAPDEESGDDEEDLPDEEDEQALEAVSPVSNLDPEVGEDEIEDGEMHVEVEVVDS
eukprot:m.902341 g.902341  ORF g.902341 m.902341 type:complete len:346 (-) comp60063_c0_seq4:2634-3671(-)